MRRSFIVGTGHAVPTRVLSNADLAAFVDTSDAWIRERTGIVERRVASEVEVTSDLAAAAARAAFADARVEPASIDLLVVATFTADQPLPSCAAIVQAKLGLAQIGAFDLAAACAGFVYGLAVADQFLRGGGARRALVIGAEILTRVTDWTDRTTAVLYGDGAGAAILEARDAEQGGVEGFSLGSDGRYASSVYIPAGGSAEPPGALDLAADRSKMRLQGKEIFRHAVENMVSASLAALERAGMTVKDVDWFVPHQASERIASAVGTRLGADMARFVMNLERRGNTSSASIPIALDEARRDGRIRPGHRVLVTALGAGLAWGAAVFTL
ncbi:MAG: beta-ketoacyl-ACP synthase III [Polyangiaceae bacterium]